MPALLRLMRPKQWTKNLLVFAALLFTAGWRDAAAVQSAIWAFLALCLLSSAIYVMNDALDVESDRIHPTKRTRPLASGQVSLPAAAVLGSVCAALAMLIGWTQAPIGASLVVFLCIQIAYSLMLKKIAVLDVMTIAALFVQRAVIGAIAISAPISPWILMCTATLALMLGFGKRRQEFRTLGADARDSLRSYTPTILDAFVWLAAGLSLVSYMLYVVESETAKAHSGLLFTAPFVLFGVLRYLLVLSTSERGEEPETLLLQDPGILASVVGFVIIAVLAMTNQISASVVAA